MNLVDNRIEYLHFGYEYCLMLETYTCNIMNIKMIIINKDMIFCIFFATRETRNLCIVYYLITLLLKNQFYFGTHERFRCRILCII